MQILQKVLDLLRSLFGKEKRAALPEALGAPSILETPVSAPEPVEAVEAVEPPDEPPGEVDDPLYDVDHVTPDDHTARDPLPDPEPEVVEEVLEAMTPVELWAQRQQWLIDLGYDPGPVDGKPGPKTEKAVKAFQKAEGLAADGVWGPKTQAAITRALRAKAVPQAPSWFTPPPPIGSYQDMIGNVELDADFYASFVDLTAKSNVLDEKGRRRRKGIRKWKALVRFCLHQTAFTWKPYRVLKAANKYSSHHKINAHVCFDTDGSILLIHNLMYYLWTANAFNPDCLSFEVMGNFEGELGTGNWYKPDTFGRGRPTRLQLIRVRQFIKWLLDPDQGPADDKLPKPLLEWRLAIRELDFNPLKWMCAHRQATDDRPLDCGSECWYHLALWVVYMFRRVSVGPEAGKGMGIPGEWSRKPSIAPLAS